MNLIKGLPENLRHITDSDMEELYKQTERLYLVGSSEFVHHTYEKTQSTKVIDNRICFILRLTTIKVEIKGKFESFPISASISFFRRPQDDMVVAAAYCCSLVCHHDIFENKLLKLLPLVKKDIRLNVFSDSAVESRFTYWCEEKVTSRNAIIKEILETI